MTDWTYVYVMGRVVDGQPTKPAKIGITKNHAARFRTISTSSPFSVEGLVAIPLPSRRIAESLEGALHEFWKEERLNGEWFDVCPIEAAISVCVFVREMYEAAGFSERDALVLCERFGVTNAIQTFLRARDLRAPAAGTA